MQEGEIQNNFVKNIMNVLYSLSLYSPIIICVSIVVFSMFTKTLEKSFVFFLWIFVITFIRIIIFKGILSDDAPIEPVSEKCISGITELFIPQDVTYSTYLLTFTMIYFIGPMFMISKQKNVNMINYGVLSFFIIYIILDVCVKSSLSCIPGIFSKIVIANILSGLFLGGVIVCLIMYGSNLKNYLYINEINSNREVCSMPSKQQFKCKLYKDGTLIGDL